MDVRLLASKLWRIRNEVMTLTERPKTKKREIIKMSDAEDIRNEFTGSVWK